MLCRTRDDLKIINGNLGPKARPRAIRIGVFFFSHTIDHDSIIEIRSQENNFFMNSLVPLACLCLYCEKRIN